MSQVLRARRLLTEQGWLEDHQLRMESGIITAIEPIPAGVHARDADQLCPAFIDTHVHGGAGVDVMDDAQRCWTRWRCIKRVKAQGLFTGDRHRTAGDCPPGARTHRPALHVRGPGAQILGSYLEGPYLRHRTKGHIRRRCFVSWMSANWTR